MADTLEQLIQDSTWKERVRAARQAGHSYDEIEGRLRAKGVLQGGGDGSPVAAEGRQPVVTPLSFGQVRASLNTPEAIRGRREAERVVPEVLGGAAGGALGGAAGGPPGALYGATVGIGLARTGTDIATGNADWRRDALLTLGGLAGGYYSRGLSLARRIIATGLSTGIAGQMYDVATGRTRTQSVPQQIGTVASDVGSGVAGQVMAEAAPAAFPPQPPRPSVLPEREQVFRARFSGEEDIPLSASGRTGSRAVAKVEQLPTRVPLGADRAAAFYEKQAEALDASIQRRLDRMEALAESRTPTAVGTAVREELPKIADEVDRAADQAFTAVKSYFRPGVSSDVTPTRWVDTARSILSESEGAPYSPPGHPGRIVTAQTTEPPPVPVLYDAAGKPITLEQIAAAPKPMTYDRARFALKQMGARTFRHGQPVIGDVDDAIRTRLWGALNDDINTMLEQHPESQELYRWSKRAYGLTKEMLVQRLQPFVERGEVEQVAKHLLPPGMLKRTRDMQQILPREVFDQVASGLARQWYDEATVGGVWSDAKYASALRPYVRSGQVDVMFPPPTARFFREAVRFQPALKSTERLAGNPSGTAQTLASLTQMGMLAQPALHPMSPLAWKTAALGAAPYPAAAAMFSEPGIGVLTRLANEGLARTLARGTIGSPVAARASGVGLASDPYVPEWLLRALRGADLSALGSPPPR